MSTILSLPAESLFQIISYCSFQDLRRLSTTNQKIRHNCGMLKLNELYNVALQSFRGLQANFEFKSCWSRELDSDQMINIYVVTLQNFHYSINEKIKIDIKPDLSPNPFIVIDTQFSLCSPSSDTFDLTESIDSLVSNLNPNQFIAAVRLGEGIATPTETPEKLNYIQKFFYPYLSSTNENVRCDIHYPLKEIKIFPSKELNLFKNEVFTIEKAAIHIIKIKKTTLSSETYDSGLGISFLKKLF